MTRFQISYSHWTIERLLQILSVTYRKKIPVIPPLFEIDNFIVDFKEKKWDFQGNSIFFLKQCLVTQ